MKKKRNNQKMIKDNNINMNELKVTYKKINFLNVKKLKLIIQNINILEII